MTAREEAEEIARALGAEIISSDDHSSPAVNYLRKRQGEIMSNPVTLIRCFIQRLVAGVILRIIPRSDGLDVYIGQDLVLTGDREIVLFSLLQSPPRVSMLRSLVDRLRDGQELRIYLNTHDRLDVEIDRRQLLSGEIEIITSILEDVGDIVPR
jgi:hypothetical protein